MPSENIDNLIPSDGDLSSLIGSTQYQSASPADIPDGVNLQESGEPGGPVGQQYANVAGAVETPAMTAAETTGGVDPETHRIRQQAYEASQAAFRATQQRIEAEERAFEASIAHLPEDEQDRLILQREVEQTRQVNSYLNNQIQTSRQQQEAAQQDWAKRQWGFLYANQAGLPFDNPGVRAAVMAATSRQEMQQIVQNLVAVANGGRQGNIMNQINGGAFAAGGNRGATSSAQGPKKYSGDTEGLIASRGYITVNMG